jgi:hypothetical protein
VTSFGTKFGAIHHGLPCTLNLQLCPCAPKEGNKDEVNKIAAWLGALTLAGVGQGVKWFYEIRKLRAETAEVKIRLAATEHSQLVERLALLLVRRAECLDPNAGWLKKVDWAVLLKENANLIDEVFASLQRDDLLEASGVGIYKIGYKPPSFSRKRG